MDGLGVLERALAPPEVWLASLGSQWSSLPSFILFFGVLFAFALVAWKFGASLSWDQAALLGSCTMSSVHAVWCCVAAWPELAKLRHVQLDAVNTPSQSQLAQFSLAYMVADVLFYLVPFTPGDFMFLVHHCISGFYVLGTLCTGVGAVSSMIMFFLGEVTSPLLNAFTFMGTLRQRSWTCFKLYEYLSPSFTAAFVLMRTLLGVPLISWFLYTLIARSPAIPLSWRIPMAACVLVGITGSQAWSAKLLAGPWARLRATWELGTAKMD
ncbi:hypothetical protein ACKKBG_A30310 [Auxenochlorella protothecoides x Auxenochlorella symbiontica]